MIINWFPKPESLTWYPLGWVDEEKYNDFIHSKSTCPLCEAGHVPTRRLT